MAESKSKNTSPSAKSSKVFDVEHPSKTVASSTSKPVIVGHTNTMKKDPMVSPVAQPAAKDEPSKDEGILDKPKKEMTIHPPSSKTPPETGAIESFELPEDKDSESVNEQNTQVTNASPEQKDPEPQEVSVEASEGSEDSEPSAEGGAVEAIVAGVNTKKEKKDKEDKEIKIAEEIQALTASKKYYVKIHLTPGKRNFRWLLIFIIIAGLATGGWYVGVGPGKDLWSKDPEPVPATPVSQQTESTENAKTEEVIKEQVKTFENPAYPVAFEYPSDWTVETSKDTEFDTRDVITLKSPAETIKTTVSGSQPVDAEVFLRTRIFIENTVNPNEYASDLVNLTSCDSEDIVVSSTTMRLLFIHTAQASPSVSQVSIGPNNCTAAAEVFTANDQVQLPTKKNTYIIYSEYIFSEAHLKKNGTTQADAIAIAQQSGITITKDEFKSGSNFAKFQELVKSFKEL